MFMSRNFYTNSLINEIFYDNFLPFYDFNKNKIDKLVENEEKYLLTIPAPGLTKENVSVNVEDDYLTVKYQKTYQPEEVKLTFSNYENKFKIPDDVNQNDITAKVENGVITIVLPKKIVPKYKKTINVD